MPSALSPWMTKADKVCCNVSGRTREPYPLLRSESPGETCACVSGCTASVRRICDRDGMGTLGPGCLGAWVLGCLDAGCLRAWDLSLRTGSCVKDKRASIAIVCGVFRARTPSSSSLSPPLRWIRPALIPQRCRRIRPRSRRTSSNNWPRRTLRPSGRTRSSRSWSGTSDWTCRSHHEPTS